MIPSFYVPKFGIGLRSVARFRDRSIFGLVTVTETIMTLCFRISLFDPYAEVQTTCLIVFLYNCQTGNRLGQHRTL